MGGTRKHSRPSSGSISIRIRLSNFGERTAGWLIATDPFFAGGSIPIRIRLRNFGERARIMRAINARTSVFPKEHRRSLGTHFVDLSVAVPIEQNGLTGAGAD